MCWSFTALENKTNKKICLLIEKKIPFSFLSISKKINNIFETSTITCIL